MEYQIYNEKQKIDYIAFNNATYNNNGTSRKCVKLGYIHIFCNKHCKSIILHMD